MSTRLQRFFAASIAALSVGSRVTSASNATLAPPSLLASAAVSSADASRLSTASTFAPSCAKRITVARPFPMPSPGDCPAPTTIATLSFRRTCSLLFQPQTQCLDHLLLFGKLAHRIGAVVGAAETCHFLVELRHRLDVRRLLHPLLEGIVQRLDH